MGLWWWMMGNTHSDRSRAGSQLALNNVDAHEIAPGIWLGALSAAEDKRFLKQQRISHVLTVLPHDPPKVPARIALLQIKVADNSLSLIGFHFNAACDFVDSARSGGGTVLVHCWRGISRSATMVCAALMRHEGLTASQALARVQEHRSFADPNPAFRTQLSIFETHHCSRDIDWIRGMNSVCGKLQAGELVEAWDDRVKEFRHARVTENNGNGFFEVQFRSPHTDSHGNAKFESEATTLNTGLARRKIASASSSEDGNHGDGSEDGGHGGDERAVSQV